MARRTTRTSRDTWQQTQPPSPEGFVPPWLLGVVVIAAGYGLHVALGRQVPGATLGASGITLVVSVLAATTWTYASKRGRALTSKQRLQRAHATVTVAVAGAEVLALFAFGLTRVTAWVCAAVSVGLALSWNIPRFEAIRDTGPGSVDRTAIAFGIEGAEVRKVREDDDKVVTEVKPALGQSAKEVQRIAEPLAAATGAPPGGTRAVITPKSAVEVTRMKRDVLAGTHPWLGVKPEDVGRSFADQPWWIGPREDGQVAWLWLPGRGTRSATHVKVAGVPGSGKGETFRVCAAQTMTCRDVLFWLVDTAKAWQTARSIVGGLDLFVTKLPEAALLMAALRKLITYRSEKLGKAGWDQWDTGCPSPAVVVWVEEAANVFGEDGPWNDDFKRIAEQARSVGIFLVASMQRWHNANVDTNIRASFSSTLCFGCDNEDAARMVLSEQTLDAGVMPTWANRDVGVHHLEATDVPSQDWSLKVKGWLGDPGLLEETVAAAATVRCEGLPDDEAAVMGDIYAKLRRNHMMTREVAVPVDTLPDETGNGADPVDAELDQMLDGAERDGIDPRQPLPPYDPESDGADGLTYLRRSFDPRELTLDEEKRLFAEMVRGLAEEGHTQLTYELLMERWPYRSQPTIGRRMRELEDQGQVRRATPLGKRFAKAHWEPVALVTTVSV